MQQRSKSSYPASGLTSPPETYNLGCQQCLIAIYVCGTALESWATHMCHLMPPACTLGSGGAKAAMKACHTVAVRMLAQLGGFAIAWSVHGVRPICHVLHSVVLKCDGICGTRQRQHCICNEQCRGSMCQQPRIALLHHLRAACIIAAARGEHARIRWLKQSITICR